MILGRRAVEAPESTYERLTILKLLRAPRRTAQWN
jgi:hypothetical protein